MNKNYKQKSLTLETFLFQDHLTNKMSLSLKNKKVAHFMNNVDKRLFGTS